MSEGSIRPRTSDTEPDVHQKPSQAKASWQRVGSVPMADVVLLVVPGLGCLALDHAEFERAQKRGQGLLAPVATPEPQGGQQEPLLDSVALAERLCVPATWLEQAARDGRIPSVRIGRRVRF